MAETDFVRLKNALAAEAGVQISKSNGKWIFKRVNKVIAGLGPSRPIKVVVGPKPVGSPGRGKKYNLQLELRMNDTDYDHVYDNVKTILECTFGIDRSKSISFQPDPAIRDAIETIYSVHPQLEEFRKWRNWAPMAFITVILRRKTCQWKKKYGDPAKIKARKRRATEKTQEESREADQAHVATSGLAGEGGAKREETGEFIHLDDSDSEDNEDIPGGRDMSMADASNMHIDPNKTVNMAIDPVIDGNEDDDDDGGVVDLSEATSERLASRPQQPTIVSTRASTPPETTSLTATINSDTASSTNTSASPNRLGTPAPMDNTNDTKAAPPPSPTPSPPLSPSLSPPPSPPRQSLPPASAQVDQAPEVRAQAPSTPTTGLPAGVSGARVDTPPLDSTGPPPATSAAPPTLSVAPFATAAKSKGSVVWRGLTISLPMLERLRELARRQFQGEVVRVPPMYQDLVDILSVDPDYDPSSEPDPLPESGTTTKRGSRSVSKDATRPSGTTAAPTTTSIPGKSKSKPRPKIKPVPESESEQESGSEPECELGQHDDVGLNPHEGETKKPGRGGRVGTTKVTGSSKTAGSSKAAVGDATAKQPSEPTANRGATRKGKEVAEGERAVPGTSEKSKGKLAQKKSKELAAPARRSPRTKD